jgi:hypothetical protein
MAASHPRFDNFEDKFGPAPTFPPLPDHVVVLAQIAAVMVILLLIQPPFIFETNPDDSRSYRISTLRVVLTTFVVVAVTIAFHHSGSSPADVFLCVYEYAYRSMHP